MALIELPNLKIDFIHIFFSVVIIILWRSIWTLLDKYIGFEIEINVIICIICIIILYVTGQVVRF